MIDKVDIDKVPELVEGSILEKEMYINQLRELSSKLKEQEKAKKHFKKHIKQLDQIIEAGTMRIIQHYVRGK